MQRGTISVRLVEEALAEPRRRGIDVGALLREAGIAPGLMADPAGRVPSSQYAALWLGLVRAMDDEFFGMDSHPMKPGSFTLMSQAVLSAATVEQGLKRALRFLASVLDDMHGTVTREGERAAVVLTERGAPRRAFTYCTFWLILHGLTCWLAGRRIPILAADFRCEAPDYVDDYQTLFTHELRFGRPRTRIVFAAAFLDLPVRRSIAELNAFLRKAPANILVKYRSNDSLTVRVRQALRASAPNEWPDFDSLAAALHMSSSTLRRRLDGEGQSYQSIKDSLRRDHAVRCLTRGQQSVAAIAEELGFADPSSFHRAFKKWTGLQPNEYRRRTAAAGT